MRLLYNAATPDHEILPLLAERWSPRAFDPDWIMPKQAMAPLLEAARWAPSAIIPNLGVSFTGCEGTLLTTPS